MSVKAWADKVARYLFLRGLSADGLVEGLALNANAQPSDELDITPEKACKILKDDQANGVPLSEAQKGMFGAKCGEKNSTTNQPCADCPADCPMRTQMQQQAEDQRNATSMSLMPNDCRANTNTSINTSTNNASSSNPATQTTSSQEAKVTRQQNITFLTTNCSCWKGKDKQLASNELFSDAELEALVSDYKQSAANVAVVNALKEHVGLTCNADEMPDVIKKTAEGYSRARNARRTRNADDDTIPGGDGGDSSGQDSQGSDDGSDWDDTGMGDADDSADGGDSDPDELGGRLMGMAGQYNAQHLKAMLNIRNAVDKAMTSLNELNARDSEGHGWDNDKQRAAAAARMSEEGEWGAGQEQSNYSRTRNKATRNKTTRNKGTTTNMNLSQMIQRYGSQEDRDNWAMVTNAAREARMEMVRKIVANISDPQARKQRAEALLKKPTRDLQEILSLLPAPTNNVLPSVTPPALYFGAGGGPVTNLHEGADDSDWGLPTTNAQGELVYQ